MKKGITLFFLANLIFAVGFVLIKYYSYVFAKEVEGEIFGIERVTQPQAVVATQPNAIAPEQLFSFAVAIRDSKGEIFTASSEDRQWAVVQKGQCAIAKFLPYAPWEFAKSGTFHGARLIKLYECGGKK